MPLYTARIIKFPERRSEIVKLKAKLEEVKRAIARTTLPARAKAEAVCAVGYDVGITHIVKTVQMRKERVIPRSL